MTYPEERFMEKWKAVIDVAKVLIGLATSVLTVILGLIVVGQLKVNCGIIISGALLIVSVILALYSFGRGIKALDTGTDQTKSILFSNLSIVALIFAIAVLPFIGQKTELSIDDMLSSIESSAKSITLPIQAGNCQSVKRVGDNYEICYESGGKTATVIFSVKGRDILEIKQ